MYIYIYISLKNSAVLQCAKVCLCNLFSKIKFSDNLALKASHKFGIFYLRH